MPKGLLNIKKNLVGYYLNEFITIMPEYGLLARSVLGTNRTIIGLREGMLNRRSAYLLQSEVRRHIHRHMFFEKHIPLHASGVIVSNQSQESILVIGPSGSGKSTLIWLLYQCGYLLLTDDNLVTDEQGKIYGAGETFL